MDITFIHVLYIQCYSVPVSSCVCVRVCVCVHVCVSPSVCSPDGYLYDKEAILESFVHQKTESE